MIYNINNPPIVIFNAIQDLSQLATSTNLDKSQQQIISHGIGLLKALENSIQVFLCGSVTHQHT